MTQQTHSANVVTGSPMRDFEVEVVRTAYRKTTIRVRAASHEEAEHLAKDRAGDVAFANEYASEYDAISVKPL